MGVFKAVLYLYKTHPELEKYISDNSLFISKEYHQEIIENLINDQRAKLREAHGITED